MGYKLSYEINSVEKVEVEEVDSNNGVTDMYDVEFVIDIFDANGEEVDSKSYKRKIAEVGGEWIFYKDYFTVPGAFLAGYIPIDIGVE